MIRLIEPPKDDAFKAYQHWLMFICQTLVSTTCQMQYIYQIFLHTMRLYTISLYFLGMFSSLSKKYKRILKENLSLPFWKSISKILVFLLKTIVAICNKLSGTDWLNNMRNVKRKLSLSHSDLTISFAIFFTYTNTKFIKVTIWLKSVSQDKQYTICLK